MPEVRNRTSRLAIPGQTVASDAGMNELLAKLLAQQSVQQPTYIQPNDPPAKAWAPVISQIGSMLAGKRAAAAESGKQERLASLLTNLAQGKETAGPMMEGPTPEAGMGPGAPVQGPSVRTPYSEQEKLSMMAGTPELQELVAKRLLGGSESTSKPSSIQEWEAFSRFSPEDQKRFLEMKRNPNILNLGDSQVLLGPGGAIGGTYMVNPKPGEMPDFRGQQRKAEEIGKDAGVREAALAEKESNLPRLETVVEQLGKLGKKATYTKSGQVYDIGRRELGLDPREAAIARKEYISKVDNEVLPLLRQTFGAAFTEREGQSLKATLGDPDASPAEKEAVLRSFIDSKRAQVGKNKDAGTKEPVDPVEAEMLRRGLLKQQGK